MTTQTATTKLVGKETTQANWLQRLGLFILILACEAVIFIFGSNYFDVFATNKNMTYNLVVSVVFLFVALLFKFIERWNKYWLIAYAFFVASVVLPSTLLLDVGNLLGKFNLSPNTSHGLAIGKFIEMIVVVVPIIVLTKMSGADMGSIFLKRGNLKLGMGIGWLVFFFLGTATFMFAVERFTSMDALVAAVIWGLVFSFVNGFMEELWLRGIFLKRFAPIIGINGAVWVTSIIFAFMHGFVFYFDPLALTFFVVNTLALGLGCGYLMVKSDSIWGAVLIHAASDFYLFIAVLASG